MPGLLSRRHLSETKTRSADFPPHQFTFRSRPKEAEGKSPLTACFRLAEMLGSFREKLSDLCSSFELQAASSCHGSPPHPSVCFFPSNMYTELPLIRHAPHRVALRSPRHRCCSFKYSEDAKPAAGAVPVEVSQVPPGSVAFTDTFNA